MAPMRKIFGKRSKRTFWWTPVFRFLWGKLNYATLTNHTIIKVISPNSSRAGLSNALLITSMTSYHSRTVCVRKREWKMKLIGFFNSTTSAILDIAHENKSHSEKRRNLLILNPCQVYIDPPKSGSNLFLCPITLQFFTTRFISNNNNKIMIPIAKHWRYFFIIRVLKPECQVQVHL